MIITATEVEAREKEYWENGEGAKLAKEYEQILERILRPLIDPLFDLLFYEMYQNHGNGD